MAPFYYKWLRLQEFNNSSIHPTPRGGATLWDWTQSDSNRHPSACKADALPVGAMSPCLECLLKEPFPFLEGIKKPRRLNIWYCSNSSGDFLKMRRSKFFFFKKITFHFFTPFEIFKIFGRKLIRLNHSVEVVNLHHF